MTMATGLDLAALRAAIGRAQTVQDEVTQRLAREFAATFDREAPCVTAGAPADPGLHWCLAPAIAKAALIGPDGHPLRGEFLPAVPLPRRMWAGGQLTTHDALRIGDSIERRSTIADICVKDGRSGTLCFVTLQHDIFSPRGLAIEERQDVVYREMRNAAAPGGEPPARVKPQWLREMRIDPVTLFRYSAVTFNGHRIHYDRSYATEIEGYAGLVVHGPFQLTLLLDFAASIKGRPPRAFAFRALQPLLDFVPFELCARDDADGALQMWVQTQEGVRTITSKAEW